MAMFQALDEDGIPLARPCTSRDVASLIAELEDAPTFVVSINDDELQSASHPAVSRKVGSTGAYQEGATVVRWLRLVGSSK